MAGAGYKLFNTGDVLTAAQVNTYLQEQTVMVFASAAARTTALSGVLAEGMVTYLKDTDAVEKYNGTAWVSLAGAASPLTTKGDLYTYTTTDARLGVGSNGETLIADSTQTSGLRWGANYGFTAGKNKIINGDFYINQRAFSSTTTAGAYGFDRWYLSDNTTMTYSAQNFTAGTAPVAGYEGKSFARSEVTTSSAAGEYGIIIQPIEDVRNFAGQTVTVSLWAKAASGTPKLGIELYQSFGSGGSAGVSGTGQSVTLSTSWTRYSVTIAVPSISGKTIGTGSSLDLNLWFTAGSNLATRSGSVGNQSATIDVWGVQLEAGSVATAFQTATGTLQGELAACQRYLPAISGLNNSFQGMATSTTQVYAPVIFAVTPRVAPTGITVSSAGHFILINGSATAGTGVSTVAFDSAGTTSATIGATITAGNPTIAANQPAFIRSNNASSLILFTGCEL